MHLSLSLDLSLYCSVVTLLFYVYSPASIRLHAHNDQHREVQLTNNVTPHSTDLPALSLSPVIIPCGRWRH